MKKTKLRPLKNKTQVIIRISVTSPAMHEIVELMEDMDLGIGGISAPEIYTISWTTDAKVNPAYLKLMTGKLKEFYEMNLCPDFKILNIETKQCG